MKYGKMIYEIEKCIEDAACQCGLTTDSSGNY